MGLPRLNQYLTADKVSCSRTQHSESAGSETWTSNPSIPSLTLYQQSHYAQQQYFAQNVYLFRFEPWCGISNNVACATSKASDQPAHMRSLIRAFASHLNIVWVLSYGVTKLKWRLHRLVWVYTFQNATLLEITCHGSYMNGHTWSASKRCFSTSM